MVDKPAVEQDALAARLLCLSEAAAELGTLRPDLFILAAEKLGIEGNDNPANKVSTLISLGVANANRGESRKPLSFLRKHTPLRLKSRIATGKPLPFLHLGNTKRNWVSWIVLDSSIRNRSN